MQHNYHNISQTGRRIAGMTQERWAEALDISVESVRLYESGRGMPSDDVATRMVEVSGAPVLGYWHLLNKSRVAADLLARYTKEAASLQAEYERQYGPLTVANPEEADWLRDPWPWDYQGSDD